MHNDVINLPGQILIFHKDNNIISCGHYLTGILPLPPPRVSNADELQIVVCIAKTPEGISQCCSSRMSTKRSASDPVKNIGAFDMNSIESLESFTCPIFKPHFPNILRPLPMLKITELGETDVIFIRHGFHDSPA